jgi:hypothetical protein
MNPYLIVGLVLFVMYMISQRKTTGSVSSTPGETTGISGSQDLPPSVSENNTVATNVVIPASMISSLPTPGSGSGASNPVLPYANPSVMDYTTFKNRFYDSGLNLKPGLPMTVSGLASLANLDQSTAQNYVSQVQQEHYQAVIG